MGLSTLEKGKGRTNSQDSGTNLQTHDEGNAYIRRTVSGPVLNSFEGRYAPFTSPRRFSFDSR